MSDNPKSIGRQLVENFDGIVVEAKTAPEEYPYQEEFIAAIDTAIAAATERGFKLGFDHAVEGGHEAARQLPALKDKLPIVLYFANDADRREMIDAIHLAKPGLVEARWPDPKP
jgi:hypothetical protein